MANDDELAKLCAKHLGPAGTVQKYIASVGTILERVPEGAAATVTWKLKGFSCQVKLDRVQGGGQSALKLDAVILRGKREAHSSLELKKGVGAVRVCQWLEECLAAAKPSA